MKTLRTFSLLLFAAALAALFVPALFAQDDQSLLTSSPTGEVAAPVSLLQGLIPFLTPLLIMVVKFFVPKIPKPLLPWIAPLLGAAVSWIGNLTGLSEGNVLIGAILGSAGVGVREAYDQAKKGLATNASGYGGGPLALLLLPLVLLGSGCASLDKNGIYAGDKILYTTDQTIVGAYDTMHTFVKWEFENRALLKEQPEITKSADAIRTGAQKWITSAIALRDAYAASPTEENRSKLQSALSILKQALAESVKYIEQAPPKTKQVSRWESEWGRWPVSSAVVSAFQRFSVSSS